MVFDLEESQSWNLVGEVTFMAWVRVAIAAAKRMVDVKEGIVS